MHAPVRLYPRLRVSPSPVVGMIGKISRMNLVGRRR